jgi:hypothetical protein
MEGGVLTQLDRKRQGVLLFIPQHTIVCKICSCNGIYNKNLDLLTGKLLA